MREFCDYLEQISAKCDRCWENGIGACHIKLSMQDYFPKEFALWDTIQIIRHDTRLTVETDIEVKYRTEYPYGRLAGKGPQFAVEYAEREKEIRDFLKPKLPLGVELLSSHQHYTPDKYDPNIVAIHIHAHKTVEDLDEAKHVVSKLTEVIMPKELEAFLTKK
ncbi:hypothetical protein ES703_29517 [subsurface metagenome]